LLTFKGRGRRKEHDVSDPHLDQAILTVAKLTVPEILEANLIRASFFLTAYELFEFSVVDQLRRAYLDYRLSMTPKEREEFYQREVRELDQYAFGASLKWYKKEGILSAQEVTQAQELRELRNKLAHSLPQLLTEPGNTIESLDIDLLETLIYRLDRWFTRTYEIPTIEELEEREIPDEEIMSGNMAVLFLMRETLTKTASRGKTAQIQSEDPLP
jgi:hypothetical protein